MYSQTIFVSDEDAEPHSSVGTWEQEVAGSIPGSAQYPFQGSMMIMPTGFIPQPIVSTMVVGKQPLAWKE